LSPLPVSFCAVVTFVLMTAPWGAEARGDDRPIIVKLGDDGTAPPAGAIHRMGAMPFTASYAFNAMTYSPDGKRLLSTHPGGAVIVWDAATGRRVITIAEEGSYARSGCVP
jgi:hypothetical protein